MTVDGRVAKLGDRALPSDTVAVDGKAVVLQGPSRPRVLLYHKPVGEMVTRHDPQGRPTVFAKLPPGRWVAVGRLDLNSSGLLLFTDSGELANRLMHPRYEIEREYEARVHGRLGPQDLQRLRTGVEGIGAFTRLEEIRRGEGTNSSYRVVLKEGRNREVRRLFDAVGARVNRLVRIRYGPVQLPENLSPGEWRELENPVILQKL